MPVKTVEEYLAKHSKWEKELNFLRAILLATSLEENIKWGAPVYSFGTKNIVSMAGFKNHFCLWFYQGVFLTDSKEVLTAGSDTTKAMRQWRFSSINEMDKKIITSYIHEAIENHHQGKELLPQKSTELEIPEELKSFLSTHKSVQEKFNSLTFYKQKEYCEYIATAKQQKTKLSRIEKIKPLLEQGIGLHDKYRK